jgi:hypothetical protein
MTKEAQYSARIGKRSWLVNILLASCRRSRRFKFFGGERSLCVFMLVTCVDAKHARGPLLSYPFKQYSHNFRVIGPISHGVTHLNETQVHDRSMVFCYLLNLILTLASGAAEACAGRH